MQVRARCEDRDTWHLKECVSVLGSAVTTKLFPLQLILIMRPLRWDYTVPGFILEAVNQD
jgi:hypothetical protein